MTVNVHVIFFVCCVLIFKIIDPSLPGWLVLIYTGTFFKLLYWISKNRQPEDVTFERDNLVNMMLHLKRCKMSLDAKVVIKKADMPEEMQHDAVNIATQASEKYNIQKDIAACIKKEFDKKYNPMWHCIVGHNFGSCFTHETKHFIYFYLGQVAILLFKSG
ncbi:Dynein light chain 1, cytoplasmic, partial [Stegodyphus mimosarum]